MVSAYWGRGVWERSKPEQLEQQSSELPGRRAETQGRGYKWTEDLLTADLLVCTVLQSQSRPDPKTFPAIVARTLSPLAHMRFTQRRFTASPDFGALCTFNGVTIRLLSARLNHCSSWLKNIAQSQAFHFVYFWSETQSWGRFQTQVFTEKFDLGHPLFLMPWYVRPEIFFSLFLTPPLTRFPHKCHTDTF